MLANANFEGTILYGIFPIANKFPDFTHNWYIQFGPYMINTMILNAFTPQLDFIKLYLKKFILRTWDRGLLY